MSGDGSSNGPGNRAAGFLGRRLSSLLSQTLNRLTEKEAIFRIVGIGGGLLCLLTAVLNFATFYSYYHFSLLASVSSYYIWLLLVFAAVLVGMSKWFNVATKWIQVAFLLISAMLGAATSTASDITSVIFLIFAIILVAEYRLNRLAGSIVVAPAVVCYPIVLSYGYGRTVSANAILATQSLLLAIAFLLFFSAVILKHWRQHAAAAELLEARVQERTRDLQSALDERSVMLQEIHHRVKNNLQIIASLLHLEAAKMPDANVERAAENSIRRIRAMSLVHETLYLTRPLHQVELDQYVRQLVSNIRGSIAGTTEVSVESFGPIAVSPEFAVPFGLVLSELVTNAIIHAFPEGRAGRIAITLKAGDDVVLVVGDDGVGMPQDLDPENPSYLGLRIVRSLVEQLEGRLSRGAQHRSAEEPARSEVSGRAPAGTVWTITLPRPNRATSD